VHFPIDRTVHTTTFGIPVVGHDIKGCIKAFVINTNENDLVCKMIKLKCVRNSL